MRPTTGINFTRFCLGTLLAVLAVMLPANVIRAQDSSRPEIVAQGFNMSVPQSGELGQFDRLRIRIVASERIEELYIRERSFEVDLATTLDRANYRLFGIEKRIRQYKDVTIDLKTYVNEKFVLPGRYRFNIRARDGKGRIATADLDVTMREPPDQSKAEPGRKPVDKGLFRFERVGARAVQGADEFGIAWTTIDSTNVIIRIGAARSGNALARVFTTRDYEGITTREDLAAVLESIDDSRWVEHVDLYPAHNGAADTVLAIDTPETFYLARMTNTTTSLSSAGTTVVLEGDYKFVMK